MANRNTTVGERQQAKALRASIDAEQARRRQEEAAVVAAHRNAAGPTFSTTPGESPKPQGRKINIPG